MYILVRNKDQKIIGSAAHALSSEECERRGLSIFKIKPEEFSQNIIGKKLDSYEIEQ